MGTTARRFYPHSVEWDGTDPASGDVRTCETSLPAIGNTTSCDFGTSGSKTITVDPYTFDRTTTGLTSAFGWAIDLSGSDGMDGAADAKRRIPSGTWLFQGSLRAQPAASLNAVTVGMNVYRVAAAPSTTRTLLFSDSVNAGLITTSAVSWSRTTASQSEIILEAGETIQVTYTLACTGQAGGLQIYFDTGDASLTNDCYFDVPSPGVRTQYQETITATCVVTATIVDGTKTLTGVVYDANGAAVNGATAKLFNQSTDTRISTDTTGADGVYEFTRADNDTASYYVVGYSDASHHGTSDRDLTAT